MNMIKRSLLVAAGFAFVAASAFAQDVVTAKTEPVVSQAIQLTDAELDNVTAGSALVSHAVFNSGNASVFKLSGDPASGSARLVCVNCTEVVFPGVEHIHAVQNNSGIVFHCKGAGCAAIPVPPRR